MFFLTKQFCSTHSSQKMKAVEIIGTEDYHDEHVLYERM